MHKIDPREFVSLLSGGTQILTIRAKIVPSMKKTHNPFFGKVHKIVVSNGFTGFDYEKTVNRRLDHLGDHPHFVAQDHAWGHWYNSYFLEKDGNLYLRFSEKSRKEFWFCEGKRLDPTHLFPYLSTKKEQTLSYRNYALNHLLAVRFRGVSYVLR